MVLLVIMVAVGLAILLMTSNYLRLKNLDEGTADMSSLALIIRNGAKTFMISEYKIIIAVVLIVAISISLFIEKYSGFTFILGACMSSATCIIGMRSATYANVRTANTARTTHSIGETVKVALMGGSISGLSVQAFGLFGLLAILLITGGPTATNNSGSGFISGLQCNPTIMQLSTYSLGCSVVAMFNRVAGGNYTKAADISADIVAKIRHDMPEDDSRMPNTVADFIGDNVNDISGNCSDLLESFVATIVASILIAISISNGNSELFQSTISYPLLLASGGLISCIVGISFTLLHKNGKDASKELNAATYISAAIIIIVGGISSFFIFKDVELYDSFVLGWASPWISSILGIASGVAIGKITEFYTSTKYESVKQLAKSATEGSAFVITKGDAVGSRSCLLPILVIGISLFVSGKLCGVYGVAIAALGMLSFVATTVSIDAFGPIADNAGGIAESCHLEPEVREITDQLDAVGNTTAAIGKGFAIGSAAFATVSLIFAYVGSYSQSVEPVLNIASFVVIAGGVIGGALIEYFSALLTDNTIESARLMAEEGDRQLSIPGVLDGSVKPDYDKCIQMAAKQALKKMLVPSLLALLVPVISGLFFGVEFVGGILIGATIVAIPRAIFMGNSGGAFDNAKKFIESGHLRKHGKNSKAHKAAIVGDTVGDTRKDVVGVALDIFIKTMSTVANTLAPIFVAFHFF